MNGATVHSSRRGSAALLTIDHAPVNSLSQPTRLALWEALLAADADPAVETIVITGADRGFSAGGELGEMKSPAQQAWPGLSDHLFARIEACSKPVVAALHGFAVGGGLEMALACHYRIAERSTRIALPEVRHGVVPPSGSQRLPRAVGVTRALDLIVGALTLPAGKFADTDLFDRLCDGEVVEKALAFAMELDRGRPPARSLLRHRPLERAGAEDAIAAVRARLSVSADVTEAMVACVDAVAIAVSAADFDAGLVAAKKLHDELRRRRIAA